MRAVVHGYFSGESSKTNTLIRNEVDEEALGDLLGCDPKKRNETYVVATFMYINRLDAWLAPVVSCIVDKVKGRGHH